MESMSHFFASIYYCDLVDQNFLDSEFLEQISISIDRYTAVSCGNLLKHSEMFENIGIMINTIDNHKICLPVSIVLSLVWAYIFQIKIKWENKAIKQSPS